MIAAYATRPSICDVMSIPLPGIGTPHMIDIAANTPNSAPPAMNPDAISVPRSLRARLTSGSFDERFTK